MRKFVRRLRREQRGLTLIELIAAISLFSMVSMTIYGVIQFGFSAYHKITIENSLRDEGDLVMSTVISQLYSSGSDSIQQVPRGIQLIDKDKKIYVIHFQNNQLEVISNNKIEPLQTHSRIADDSEIKLTCKTGGGQCSSGLIEISLHLYQMYGEREQDLVLKSRFGF